MTAATSDSEPGVGRRWLARFAVLAVALNVVSFGVYITYAFVMDAPESIANVIALAFAIYAPAYRLAYAVAHSDFPMIQFAFFAFIENIILAALAATAWVRIEGHRRRRAAGSADGVGADAGPA